MPHHHDNIWTFLDLVLQMDQATMPGTSMKVLKFQLLSEMMMLLEQNDHILVFKAKQTCY